MITTDIARERASASFSSSDLQVLLDGGIEKHQARKLAYQMIERDPLLTFKDGHPYDLTRKEMREKTMIQLRRYYEIAKTIKEPVLAAQFYQGLCELSESFSMRTYVHDFLYKASITLFGTEEQKARLLPDVLDHKVFGCFAMTELGHSSSLRDLETTATLDLTHDEWIIHSPTLTSTKWWIGMSGQAATHTIIVAQTIVNNVPHGLNWFILPLRDPVTGRLLPGITCGDIGAKMGRHGLDNGWIQASHVRVPRTNMLMKWSQVEKDGKVTPPPHPSLVYATLIPERLAAVTAIRYLLAQSAVIACRYGVTRRQGTYNQQIIDYQAQQVNLIPMVASVYVWHFTSQQLLKRWEHLQELSHSSPMDYVAQLPDIHALSAGTKAVSTWWMGEQLELCRRACGGHAYSAYNAIADHMASFGVLTTGGGDNYPMSQQLARYVLTCVQRALAGKKNIGRSAKFLERAATILKANKLAANSPSDFENLQTYRDLFAFLTVQSAVRLSEQLSLAGKANQEDAWNANMVELIQLSTFYVYQHTIELFEETIAEAASTLPKLVPLLRQIGALFAAKAASQVALESALETGYLTSTQTRHVKQTVVRLSAQLRKDVVPLTDAFGFPDFILKAPIGRYDGDIYKAYFDIVKAAPDCFNTPYWDSEVKPILHKL